MKQFSLSFQISLLAFFLSGCAYINPFIQSVNIIPLDQEKELGTSMSAEVTRSMPIVDDRQLTNRVQSIGNKLIQALPVREFDYKFHVIQNNAPNAFTIPGGSIYVHTGLLQISDDSELAGVLGHEIGHAYHRHPARSLSRLYGLEYLSNLALKGNQSNAKTVLLQFIKTGIFNKYSRDDEREADEIGYFLVKKAGFPVDGLLRFLRKLQSVQGSAPLPFLSTHPPTIERIARLEALAKNNQNTSPRNFL